MKCVKCKVREQSDDALTKGLCLPCFGAKGVAEAAAKFGGAFQTGSVVNFTAQGIYPTVPSSLHECPSCKGVGIHKIGCAGAETFIDYSQLKATEGDGSWWKNPTDPINLHDLLTAAPMFPTATEAMMGLAFDANMTSARHRFADGTDHTFKVPKRIGADFHRAVMKAART